MTPLYYTLRDAQCWAAFSGDYNPVHFDEVWMKARGESALSVHGMRALLDVKCFISPGIHSSPFLKCTVRLRKPLWCDNAYVLTRDEKKTIAATVTDFSAGHACLSCQITPEDTFPLSDYVYQHEVGRTAFSSLHHAFTPLLPMGQQWHFLDALLFRYLIQDDALLSQSPIAAILPSCRNLETLFARFPVVQTHQEVIFDSHLLAGWPQDISPETLTIEILPALVVGDLQQGAIVRIAARTRYQHHAISNAITLKVGPAATQ